MGLHTPITRTTDTVIAATTSAAGAVTAATTSVAGATGGAALGAGLGAVRGAADGLRDGAERGSRSAPAAALTVTALTVTGILDWPLVLAAGGTAILVNRLTQTPGEQPRQPGPPVRGLPRRPRHHQVAFRLRRPPAPGQGPPEKPGRRDPRPRRPGGHPQRPPHLHLHLPRRRNSRLASGPEPPGHGGGAGRVAHGEFICSDRSWVASLTVRPALTPCRTPRTHPQPRLQFETSPSPKRPG